MSNMREAHGETFGQDGYVHYLDRCIHVKTQQYTSNMYSLLYVNYTSVKLLKNPRKKNLKGIFSFFSSHSSYCQWKLLSIL